MSLELRQQLKLAQQLVMTPQLQQAIRLLQLSRVDLMENIQHELLENPFLEEHQDDLRPEPNESRPTESEPHIYDREVSLAADWEDYLGEFASTPRGMNPRDNEQLEDQLSPEAGYAEHPTLANHLLWQLRLSSMTEKQKRLGEIVIGNLSSSGYMQANVEEMAEMAQCTPRDMELVLRKIQFFDPVGVAARTPQECLLTQIEALGYDRDPVLVSLVRDHLEDLENSRYKPLLRKHHIDMEELREYLAVIQSLDPMPGASFGGGDVTYVSPDVYVCKSEDEFIIILNEEDLPQLSISPDCEKFAEKSSGCEKDYFSEKFRAATWLIKSLHQRQRTLYKVMESIVKHQQDFFEHGITHLKPLVLRDIADDIGMHESTISRVTSNKYVATPYGIFELKFFFNSALGMADGNQVGSESVKALIKKCINEEDPKKPLSDDSISEILKERLKVNIARRTVAKYRTAMNIPSSSRRKVHL